MPSIPLFAVLLVAALLARAAQAEPPKVVVSINPLYALSLAVMDGVPEASTPELLVPANREPHAYPLKPSGVRKLAQADVVLWFGPGLETALEGSIATVGENATVISMLTVPGLKHLEGDGMADPHIWLDPANAQVMIDVIARTLADHDPANAALYAKNAKVAKGRIRLLVKKMHGFLGAVKTKPFLVQHDSLRYLVAAFDLNQVGYISSVAGVAPGARHVKTLLETIQTQGVRCLFVEPRFPSALASRLASESGVRLGELDPMGLGLEPGATLYVRILQQMARQLVNCLGARPASG